MGPVVGVEEGEVEVEEGGMMVKVKIGRVEGRREVRANHRTEGDCPMFRSGVSRGCVPR